MGAKRAVNVSLDVALIEEAKSYGYNLSAVCAEAIAARNRDERAARWREDNRAAIEDANAELRKNGLWSDGLRTF